MLVFHPFLPRVSFTSFCYILSIIVLASCTTLGTRTISVSEADIQHRIAKKLDSPITLLKIFEVILSNPIVKLDDKTGRLNTTLDAIITNPLSNAPITGKFSISGLPRLDVATNTLMLVNTKVESLNIDNTDTQFNKLVNKLTKSFSDDLLNEIPLYTVKPDF